jgi:hypothetical protein
MLTKTASVGSRNDGTANVQEQDQQGRRDSNSEPPVLETGALPVELRPLARPSVDAGSCETQSMAKPGGTKRSRGRNRPLGVLFVVLSLGLAGIAVAALRAEVWVVGFAAAVLALWLGSLARTLLSSR